MREIKFRAWDKEHKKMFKPNIDIFFSLSGTQMTSCYSNLYFEHLICMQFTGLKDKNNKEIYFGYEVDFTYTNSDGHDIETTGIIEMDLKFTLGIIIRENHTQALLNIVHTDLSNIRLTGRNIYENPELIK